MGGCGLSPPKSITGSDLPVQYRPGFCVLCFHHTGPGWVRDGGGGLGWVGAPGVTYLCSTVMDSVYHVFTIQVRVGWGCGGVVRPTCAVPSWILCIMFLPYRSGLGKGAGGVTPLEWPTCAVPSWILCVMFSPYRFGLGEGTGGVTPLEWPTCAVPSWILCIMLSPYRSGIPRKGLTATKVAPADVYTIRRLNLSFKLCSTKNNQFRRCEITQTLLSFLFVKICFEVPSTEETRLL